METPIEVELRYKVKDTEATIKRLAELGIAIAMRKHVIDQWFAPTHVRSLPQEKQWFDVEHGVAYRIRRIEQPDGSYVAAVDTKQLTEHDNHDTFLETPSQEMPYDDAIAMLAAKDYRCWLTIDKMRTTFTTDMPEFDIVLDEIAGMAEKIGVSAGIEIEYKGTGTRDEALKQLGDFALQLGFSETDRFEQSFTVASMDALAKFED